MPDYAQIRRPIFQEWRAREANQIQQPNVVQQQELQSYTVAIAGA